MPELIRAAEARGVATSYQPSHGLEVAVSPETIEAILAALGEPPTAPLPPVVATPLLLATRSWPA